MFNFRNNSFLLLFFYLSFLFSPMALAAIDPIEEILSEDYPAALRWDNIEGEPLRLSGEAINFSVDNRLHIVRLKLHQQISIHLNRSEMLRILSIDKNELTDSLSIEASNGSSLYSSIETMKDDKNTNLIVAADNSSNRIIKISNRIDQEIRIALFVSRRDFINRLAPYRNLLELPLKSVELVDHARHQTNKYWLLNKSIPSVLPLNGSKRIAIEIRFKYQQDGHFGNKPFHLSYSFDKGEPEEIHLLARQDHKQYYTINGQGVSVSRNETVYLDIPIDKQQLHLKSSDAVYIRILALDEPDYLFPELNENPTSIKEARSIYNKYGVNNKDIDSLLNKKLLANELFNMQWIASFIAINNEVRDSALDAISLLENTGSHSKGLKQANHFVKSFRRQHTFYRKLLPFQNNADRDFSHQQFILYPLRQWNKPAESYHMIEPYFSNSCESLNQGYFFSLSDSSDSALNYHLPERIHDTRLRVIVDQKTVSDNDIIYLQFDDDNPVELSVFENNDLAVGYFNPSTPEACVSRSLYKSDIFYPIHLGHNLEDVAYLEIPLPARVNRIKIWNTSTSGAALIPKVALQYQTSRPYEISQQFYIDLTRQFQNKLFDQVFLPFVNNEEVTNHILSPNQLYRLTQSWAGVKAYLLSRKNLFSSAYIDTKINVKKQYSDDETVDTVYRNIELNRQKQQWLEIIERFASLNINPEHRLYVKFHKQFYYALEQVGENNLRERVLKGALLFDDNQALTQTAFEFLKSYYEQYNFHSKLTQLLITRAYLTSDENAYKALVSHLIAQGHNRFALQIGMLLKADDFLNEKLLLASYNEKNWYYYDILVDKIPEPDKQLTWKALKSLALGDMNSLQSYLSQIETRTSYPLAFIDSVLAVRRSLEQSKPEQFLKQWRLWLQWKLEQGNETLWRSNDKIISQAQGAVSLFNQERNLYKNYFRASENKPVKLSIIGPARIRIGIRLLYDNLNEPAKKSTLILHDNNKRFISPLLNSIPAQGLRIVELPDTVAGSLQYFEYAVGDGVHDIAYYVKDYPALATLETQQLSLNNDVLPDLLTPEMLNYIVSNSKKSMIDTSWQSLRQCQNSGCMIVHGKEKAYLNRLLQTVRQPLTKNVLVDSVSFTDDVKDDFYLTNHWDIKYFQSRFLQLCLPEYSKIDVPIVIEALENFSTEIMLEKQMCIPETQRTEKAFELLVQMYWYFQQHSESRDTIEALAGSILQSFTHNPHFRQFSAFFEQGYKWVLQANVSESAGIRFDTISGWQPVSSYSRIRKALSRQHNSSMVLTDDRVSGITLSNHVDSTLIININKLSLPFHPGQNLSLRYQLDDQKWRYIEVQSEGFEKQVTVFIPSGIHTLKLQWLNSVIGQYVGINLTNKKNRQKKPIYNKVDRYYHIATEEEPVKTYMNGPARLRIDYQAGDGYSSRFVYIPDGLYRLTLPVIKNNDTVMYRIYKYHQQDNISEPQSSVIRRQFTEIPFSQWYNDLVADIDNQEARSVQLVDKYTLGRQEDGTLAFGMLWTEGEERDDSNRNTANNDYFQYSFSHYYFVEQWQSYFDTSVLYRDHDNGDPSYGLMQTIFFKPDWLSFALRFDWKYFTQDYDSPKGNRRAWSTDIRFGIEQLFTITPKWSHLPRLTVFHKNFENSGFYENATTDIDYDVWNEYGEIHDRGLIISDTLYYYPWLDTRLSSGFSYYTDEDYRLDKPEHLSLRFGWLQMLDRFFLDMNYRWTYYFSEDGHDWNRSSSSNKGIINTNLYWDSWLSPTNRLLANLKLSYDTEINDMTATIGFNYYFDQGRGFRDFRPHTESFRDLRERHRFWNDNNLLIKETK